jgi:quinol monooxygenase YgiN
VSVVVVATVYPLADQMAAVIDAFEVTIAEVHAEDAGCELYALHEMADRLIMIEKWESAEALAVHSRGAALARLAPQLEGKLVSAPEVLVLQPHPAGTPEQGTL